MHVYTHVSGVYIYIYIQCVCVCNISHMHTYMYKERMIWHVPPNCRSGQAALGLLRLSGCPPEKLPRPLWTKGFEHRRACSLGSSTGGSMSGHGDFSGDFIRISCDFM